MASHAGYRTSRGFHDPAIIASDAKEDSISRTVRRSRELVAESEWLLAESREEVALRDEYGFPLARPLR